jgi:hypothetical protein
MPETALRYVRWKWLERPNGCCETRCDLSIGFTFRHQWFRSSDVVQRVSVITDQYALTFLQLVNLHGNFENFSILRWGRQYFVSFSHFPPRTQRSILTQTPSFDRPINISRIQKRSSTLRKFTSPCQFSRFDSKLFPKYWACDWSNLKERQQ